jgi:hypothetical protein
MTPLTQISANWGPGNTIRVFPTRTSFTPDDALAFVGYPPFAEFRPSNKETPVHVSVTFKRDRPNAERIAASWRDFYRDVQISGPAYENYGDEFSPGMYLKQGCTITSRGCVKHCGWCPERNRPLRELSISPGWIVQDSNLLACSESHIRAVFDMLREQKKAIKFPGGLDKHFLQPWHRELFDSISIDELWFACDKTSDLPLLERAAGILEGIPVRKRRCYTMIGYDDETLADSERRQERVLELGFLPFCQLYRPDEGVKVYSEDWHKVQRKWCRPAAYRKRVGE